MRTMLFLFHLPRRNAVEMDTLLQSSQFWQQTVFHLKNNIETKAFRAALAVMTRSLGKLCILQSWQDSWIQGSAGWFGYDNLERPLLPALMPCRVSSHAQHNGDQAPLRYSEAGRGERQLPRVKHSLPEHVMNTSIHFQTESTQKYTLCNITFIPVTGVNEALPRAQEGHLCIHYSWLLTTSSLVLPWVTDGSAGKMDIKTSQRLHDSYGWLHLCTVAPQYLSWLWPIHIAHSREHSPGWGLSWLHSAHTGWRKDWNHPARQTQQELQTQGAAHNPPQGSFRMGPRNCYINCTEGSWPCSHLSCGAQDLWGYSSDRRLRCSTSKRCQLLSLLLFWNIFLAVTARLPW